MPRKQAVRARDSETSKAAILTAARQRFAAEGYDRATIRAIASDADIDPAMVIRYFASKEKLFAEAADFDLRLPDLTSLPRGRAGAALVDHFVGRWEGDETFMALIRSAVTNEVAAKRVRRVLADQVAPAITALSGEATNAGLRSGLVATQLMGMALCRYVLRLPPLVAMSRRDIVAWLGPTVQRYITSDAPA